MKKNIVLIGMPGSGKTTVGREIARRLGWPQADGDAIIEDSEGKTLQEIQDSMGMEYFLELEDKVLSRIDYENHVITPGGSAIYYPSAMENLARIGHLIYLNVEFAEIEKRVRNLDSRGIVFKPGQSFLDLYNERCPLYEQYADLNIKTRGMSARQTAEFILRKLGYL